jgi:serine/threonine protein kinase
MHRIAPTWGDACHVTERPGQLGWLSNWLGGSRLVTDSMNVTISLSHSDRYQVIGRKEGGMGKVYILQKLDTHSGLPAPMSYWSRRTQDEFRFIYRDLLAAKSVKSPELEEQFRRELNIWITLVQPGIAPLLKVIREDNQLLGVMPAYDRNLREHLRENRGSGRECLRALARCVAGLGEVSKAGIVHLDLKPENLLVALADQQLQIDVSDWGIANVKVEAARATCGPQGDITTIVGAGTVPYMSPERFGPMKPDLRADVFSLGVIFYELLVGELPYAVHRAIDRQIISGQYMETAVRAMQEKRLPKFVVDMLHPDPANRVDSYKDISSFVASLRG